MTGSEYQEMRKTLGSQAEVASDLGLHRKTIQAREAGGARITVEAEIALRFLAEWRWMREVGWDG